MRRTILLGAVLTLSSPLLMSQALAGAAAVPQLRWAQSAATDGSVVAKAGWYCRKWRRKCAWRWDLGTRRYYRCMVRHGC